MSGPRRVLHRKLHGCNVTSGAAYRCLARVRGGHRALFESAYGSGKHARLSLICVGSLAELRAVDGRVTVLRDGADEVVTRSTPFDAARHLLEVYRPSDEDIVRAPYLGLFGAAAYEFSSYLERVPTLPRGDDPMPDLHLIIPQTVIAFDHLADHVRVTTLGGSDGTIRDDADIVACLTALATAEQESAASAQPVHETQLSGPPSYVSSVGQAIRAVCEGEALQVVLSRALEIESDAEPFEVYRALCEINPSPYMFFLQYGWGTLFGSSPEMLVRLDGHRAVVRPLAGTTQRAGREDADARRAARLRRDPKERAEHIMLVDLGRNDLARVCVPGTVQVTPFMDIEKYSHVMHLVSQVEGELAPGRDAFDLFASAFPAGTVSGAPKIRALELIAELELERRGFYAGAILRAGFKGDIDSCITLRSMHAFGGRYTLRAGAGVVAASDPRTEDAECGHKLGACIAALNRAAAVSHA